MPKVFEVFTKTEAKRLYEMMMEEKKANERLHTALEDAEKALKIYGNHLEVCPFGKYVNAKCECGYHEALRALRERLG